MIFTHLFVTVFRSGYRALGLHDSLSLLLAALGAAVSSAQTDSQGIEFFEKKIRPVLTEHCYACHSAKTQAMAELRLDSKAGLAMGGSRGPAIVPGSPETSLLIKAISYRDPDLKMPPTGRLGAEQIEDFTAWVRMGAPDPRDRRGAPIDCARFDRHRGGPPVLVVPADSRLLAAIGPTKRLAAQRGGQLHPG